MNYSKDLDFQQEGKGLFAEWPRPSQSLLHLTFLIKTYRFEMNLCYYIHCDF